MQCHSVRWVDEARWNIFWRCQFEKYSNGICVLFIQCLLGLLKIDLEVVQMAQKGREDSKNPVRFLLPLALTTLFGNVKLLSNFCILQNILDRDLNMRILL